MPANGIVNMPTSPNRAASLGVPADARGPSCSTSGFSASDQGSRADVTSFRVTGPASGTFYPGQTITVDAQMQLGQLAAPVTVTGASPVVDVTTTKVGTTLKGEDLIAVPNSTDVWGALSEAPGIRMQGFDVGGSHKSQQSGYESFGVQNQAKVVSDGVDHTEGVR